MKRIASIAIIFAAATLAACVSQGTYNQEVQTADAAQQKASTYQRLSKQLEGELGTDQAQIQQLQGLVRVTLANGILFPEGGWELNAAGKATLGRLAPVLASLTGQTIQIKGYTDNVPIGPELAKRFPTNADLSKARAQSVASELTAHGVPASMISVAGFGDANPVASNDTPQGRAKNRRVVMDVVEAK